MKSSIVKYACGFVVTSLLVACQVAAAASLDGLWRSRGYGTILDIRREQATVYDVNHVVCLKRERQVGVAEHLFREPRLSADGRVLTAISAEGFTILYYDRIDQLPPRCSPSPPPNDHDPVLNFDAFIAWFEDDYAFSARRAIDWSRIRAQYRAQVNAQTTDAQLLEIFKAILRQLQDQHVALSGEDFYINAGAPPLYEAWLQEYLANPENFPSLEVFAKNKAKELLRPSWNRYFDPGSLHEISDNIVIGRLRNGEIGYLAVLSESGYSSSDDPAREQAAAARQLNRAFDELSGVQSLILDTRVNFGGDDGIALLLAGRFTAEDRAGLAKCTRHGAHFTPVQGTTIRHAANPFTGPVIAFGTAYNVSAGENFLMMIKDYPNVLVVGERTAGVHSDTLEKALPNGWQISISNEAFVAPDGTMYETLGVPPDVLVPYYPDVVKTSGVDPLMEKALHVLAARDVKTLMRGAKRVTRGTPSVCR